MLALVMAAAVISQPAICQKLSLSIEAAEQEIALLEAAGIGDNSAARATMNATKQAGQYGQINANILLMEVNHCAPRSTPINPTRWTIPAMDCQSAILRSVSGAISSGGKTAPVDPAECDRTKWKALGSEPKTAL